MKTFFLCIESRINDHAGEEYDDILELEDMPTLHGGYGSMGIKHWADLIRQRIRKLWKEDEDEEKGVEIYLDGTAPYHTILMRLKPTMEKEEGIIVELPYAVELEEEVEYDSETHEFLKQRKRI